MRNKMEKGRGSVRLKFWQKTYLLTLALFLLALGGGTTAIASVSQQRAFEAECGKLLAQQHSVAQSLAADAAAVQARRPEALPRLAQNYAGQLKRSGVFLRVAQAGDVWADELPQPDSALPEVPPEGQRVHTVLLSGGRHVLYISAVLPAPPEDVAVTCAFDMEAFFVQWAQTRRAFLLAGAAVFAVLAAALYVVLRGLSRPMERLARVAGRLADGDYTARSPERTRDEVGQLAHALNEMAARVERNVAELRETARRKQQLVDNVAHELRTPLTAVGGYAEYIQRAELSEEEKYEAAQYIVEEANRLAVMSERLLQMAALRGEQAAREPVDVPALLEKAARTVAPKAAARGVALEPVQAARTVAPKAAARGVALEPVQADACTVQGEAALLESLMVNLADNAVKACGPGGSVRLCARRETGRLTLTVQDTGRGMDAETLAHIGEPFYRPDKARSREQGGAGLGLALCFQIAQSHGAALSFTSAPGAGTTAAVIFTA